MTRKELQKYLNLFPSQDEVYLLLWDSSQDALVPKLLTEQMIGQWEDEDQVSFLGIDTEGQTDAN